MHVFLEEETQNGAVNALREALDRCDLDGPPEIDSATLDVAKFTRGHF